MTASPAPYVSSRPDLYLVSGDGLVRNNMHVEAGRAGYLPNDAATSESQVLLARGYARYYLASGNAAALNNARTLIKAALGCFFATKTPPDNGTWYHHWVVNAGNSFDVKGPSNPNGHAYDGIVGQAITFSGGKALLPNNLANVYAVFQGSLTWQNVYANLAQGQFFDIDYFIDRDGYLFRWQSGQGETVTFSADSQPQTDIEAGTLQMKNTGISGDYFVSYSLYSSDAIAYASQFEGWPMWRHLMPAEQVMASDAIHWFIDLFALMQSIDVENAAEWSSYYRAMLTLWQDACLLTSSETNIFKRSVIGTYDSWPLTYFYAYQAGGVSYTPPTEYCDYGRDKITGVAYFNLPNDSKRLGWVFQNDALNLTVTSDLAVTLEAAISIPASVTIALIDNQQKHYEAIVCPDTALSTYTISIADFLDYTDVAKWIPGDTDFVYGGATATTDTITSSEDRVLIARHYEITSNTQGVGFSTSASHQSWTGSAPLVLSYITQDTNFLLIIIDAAGWHWQTVLPVNADATLTSFAWDKFSLAGYQTNTTALPSAPDTSGPIQTIQFQFNKASTGTQSLNIIAAYNKMPSAMPPQLQIVSANVACSVADAINLQIGNVYIDKAGTINQPYFPGLLPFQHATIGSGRSPYGGGGLWQGPAYMGYQNPVPWMLLNKYDEAVNMLQMMHDSQLHYTQQNNKSTVGPFVPCYVFAQWDAEQYGSPYSFVFDGPDPNWGWGGFQYRAFHNVADYWARMVDASVSIDPNGNAAEKSTALARDIASSFLEWLANWLNTHTEARSIPALFAAAEDPDLNGDDPHQTALALKASLWCASAGYNKTIALTVADRLYGMLDSFQVASGDMAGSYSPQPEAYHFYGFWAGEILDALSLYALLRPYL
ncbi:MAG: hypothetical protein ABF461_04265 [Zymomonas mobilis subsp. pomaceae]|uniref:hypothetical protein n=1 Tax=Zymomonas mobilis TaxID=542 RepID=UPI0039EBA8EE